jgi:hypothetical protein
MSEQERTERKQSTLSRTAQHWQVKAGVLTFDGRGDSLVTNEEFGDFELLIDWKIEPGGDSGIYLRGHPQVQIWDAPDGSEGCSIMRKTQINPSARRTNRPVNGTVFGS